MRHCCPLVDKTDSADNAQEDWDPIMTDVMW